MLFRSPYSIVLFDEIEKAHAEVFNVLLQLLDDGRLTDGQGRTVDFRNTVVIMTSNAGSELWANNPEVKIGRDLLNQVLQKTFKPEFLNRIDEIIVFNALNVNELKKILAIQLRSLKKHLAERKIELILTPEAEAFLVRAETNIEFGARPIKRAIQRELQDPLAIRLLSGEFKDGDTILADYDENAGDDTAGITFRKTASPAG